MMIGVLGLRMLIFQVNIVLEIIIFHLMLSVSLREGSEWWEVCLAVIETETVYYLHTDLCTELGRSSEQHQTWYNLTLTPGLSSVTLGWKPVSTRDQGTVIISVREFSVSDPVFRQLITHDHQDSEVAYYTVNNLAEDTGYRVCITPLEAEWEESGQCREFSTLASSLSSVEQVAAATAVSSSSTAVIVAVVCCCCYSRKKRKKEERRDKEKGNLDVNENKTLDNHHHLHHGEYHHHDHQDAGMFHQKCPEHSSTCWTSCHAQVSSEDTGVTSGHSDDTCSNDSILYDCIKPPPPPPPAQCHPHRVQHPSIRSTHSLSSKYSEHKKYPPHHTITGIRKNASLCVRST